MSNATPLRLVVLISGSGTNLQAILDRIEAGTLQAEVAAVVSNRADAYGLERARKSDIPAEVLSHRGFADRAVYDAALAKLIDRFNPGLVVLAGFMRILSPAFVAHYAGRIMNIHPSLLPKYRGLDTHARVLDAGDVEHGVSVHFVTADLDDGPIIIQAALAVRPDETAESLQQRVHQLEYRVYPQAIQWFAQNRLTIDDGQVLLNGAPSNEQFIRIEDSNDKQSA